MNASKGDPPRPVNGEKFRSNHDRIFDRRTDSIHTVGEIFDGAESMGNGSWHLIDHRDPELRDDE